MTFVPGSNATQDKPSTPFQSFILANHPGATFLFGAPPPPDEGGFDFSDGCSNNNNNNNNSTSANTTSSIVPATHGETPFPMYTSNPAPGSLFGLGPAALEDGVPMEVKAAQFWTKMQNNSAVSYSAAEMLQVNETWARAFQQQSETWAGVVKQLSSDNAANTMALTRLNEVLVGVVKQLSSDNAANVKQLSSDNAANTVALTRLNGVLAKTMEKLMLAALEAMSSQKRSEDEDTNDDSDKVGVSEPAALPSKKRRSLVSLPIDLLAG